MNKRPKTITPVRPNEGIEAEYRKKLTRLVDEMANSVVYWIRSAYRNNEPVMAQDVSPADFLKKVMKNLARRWLKRFDETAPELAAYFAQAVQTRSDASLKAILKRSGLSIEFKMTPAQRDILDATVNANVGLIKSIPQQYLAQVEGSVMRSVQAGRNLSTLSSELRTHHGVSRRKAALISRDQNNKATSAMNRARQVELGITEAIWLHSAGGNEPRPTHVAQSGKKYSVVDGWFDPSAANGRGKRIFPGEEINCRCVSRSVLPDLTAFQGIR